MSSIIGGVLRLPLAKVVDIFGRPQGFALTALFLVAGLASMAACNSVEAYAVAQIFYWIGWVLPVHGVVERLLMSQLQWRIVRDQRLHCRHVLSQEPCLHVRVRQFSLHRHRLDDWSPGTILPRRPRMALVLRLLCRHHRRCHAALTGSVLSQLLQSSTCRPHCPYQTQPKLDLRRQILRR